MTEQPSVRLSEDEPGTIVLSGDAIPLPSRAFEPYFKNCEAKIAFYFLDESGMRASLSLVRGDDYVDAHLIAGHRGFYEWKELPGLDTSPEQLSFDDLVGLHERAMAKNIERVEYTLGGILAHRVAKLLVAQPDTRLWTTPPHNGSGPVQFELRSLGTALRANYEIDGPDAMEFFGMNTP